MSNSISRFFGRLAKLFGEEEVQEVILPKPESQQKIDQEPIQKTDEIETPPPIIEEKKQGKKDKTKARRKKPLEGELVTVINDPRDIRDVMELMEVPFVSLSKNRTAPIIYESPNGKSKVRISCHPPYHVASIYDWDIIIFVSSKLQETINSLSDIPPRTLVVSRNELIKAIHRHAGKTTDSEIEAALNRLRSTFIETTIHNEDYRYKGGFGFLDNWGYTERKDIKEFRITLSEWLYEITCSKGALLKVHPEYFKITSGLKRFLYRTARKHVGNQNEGWTFSIEALHEKSGSEQELKKFKYDLKKAIRNNDIPGYFFDWVERDGKSFVHFVNARKEIKKILSEPSTQPSLPSL
jgi:plasmid replication initiation protein